MGKLNHHDIDNSDVKIPTSEFPVEYNSESVPDTDTILIKSNVYDDRDNLLDSFYSKHYEYLLDIDLHMLQDLLVVAPPSKFYTVSTVLFHKYGGANVEVTNCMSHFSMFVPTKDTNNWLMETWDIPK